MNKLKLTALSLFLALTAACGGGSGGSNPPSSPPTTYPASEFGYYLSADYIEEHYEHTTYSWVRAPRNREDLNHLSDLVYTYDQKLVIGLGRLWFEEDLDNPIETVNNYEVRLNLVKSLLLEAGITSENILMTYPLDEPYMNLEQRGLTTSESAHILELITDATKRVFPEPDLGYIFTPKSAFNGLSVPSKANLIGVNCYDSYESCYRGVSMEEILDNVSSERLFIVPPAFEQLGRTEEDMLSMFDRAVELVNTREDVEFITTFIWWDNPDGVNGQTWKGLESLPELRKRIINYATNEVE